MALDYREVGALFAGNQPSPRDLAWMKKLIALRKQSKALRRGDFTEIATPESVYAFVRSHGSGHGAGDAQHIRGAVGT